MNREIDNIFQLIQEQMSVDISVFDETFIDKTINGRIQANEITTIADYLVYLKENEEEAAILVGSLKNGFSEFFRGPHSLLILEKNIFPLIFHKTNGERNEVRIWSAGCSSGQEPYSLAILAHDFIKKSKVNSTFRIFATDISGNGLETARKGVYDYSSMHNVKLGYLDSYFTQNGGKYTVSDEIKKYVDFSRYDLLEKNSVSPASSIFGDFDIVMCRNVLIYYKPEVRKMILEKIFRSMKKGGYLVTGEVESSIVQSNFNYRQFQVSASIFIN